jgi:hypothetical protein
MNEIYVVPFFGNWAVKLVGKDYPISTHNRKDDAIRVATQLSKRQNSQVIIQDTDEQGKQNPDE